MSEETAAELAADERRVDGLDSKAGVLLGFSGVIVALSAARLDGVFAYITAAVTVAAAMLVRAAFVPRRFPALDLLTLRGSYLGSEEEFTRLKLLDTRIAMQQQIRAQLRIKSRLVAAAVGALGIAVILVVIAVTL